LRWMKLELSTCLSSWTAFVKGRKRLARAALKVMSR